MVDIKEGMKVKYIGEPNKWTFKENLEKNSTGILKKVIEVDGITSYQVEFENGITTSIDLNDLEKFK